MDDTKTTLLVYDCVGETKTKKSVSRSREPAHAAEEVPLVRRLRLRGDGGLPVRLVHEHRSEVADDVDDAEDEPLERDHRQVRPFLVALDRTAAGRERELGRRAVRAVLDFGDGLELVVHCSGAGIFVFGRGIVFWERVFLEEEEEEEDEGRGLFELSSLGVYGV